MSCSFDEATWLVDGFGFDLGSANGGLPLVSLGGECWSGTLQLRFLLIGLRLGANGVAFLILRLGGSAAGGLERDALLSCELGEGKIGEGVLLGGLGVDAVKVELVLGNAGASGSAGALLLHHFLEAVEGVAATADACDHAASHFVEFGHRLGGLHAVEVAGKLLDASFCFAHGNVAGFDEFFIAGFGFFGLCLDVSVSAVDLFELKGELGGEVAIASAQVGGGFVAEFFFFLLELALLRGEFFDEAGVTSKALVEFGDLLAKVLLFVFKEHLRVLFLGSSNERAKKAFNEVGNTAEHKSGFLFLTICQGYGSEQGER